MLSLALHLWLPPSYRARARAYALHAAEFSTVLFFFFFLIVKLIDLQRFSLLSSRVSTSFVSYPRTNISRTEIIKGMRLNFKEDLAGLLRPRWNRVIEILYSDFSDTLASHFERGIEKPLTDSQSGRIRSCDSYLTGVGSSFVLPFSKIIRNLLRKVSFH